MQSCCSPIASASAAACSLIASTSAAAPRLWLLLAACVRFSCCSPIVSTSAAAPQLHPLQLLLPNCVRLLPDCVHFDCCFPARAPQCSQTFFTELEVQYLEVQRTYVTSLVPPHEHPTSVTRTRTYILILDLSRVQYSQTNEMQGIVGGLWECTCSILETQYSPITGTQGTKFTD